MPKILFTRPRSLKFLGLVILIALLATLYWQNLHKIPKPPVSTQPVLQRESISENEAFKIISEQSEVKEYLEKVPKAEITLDHFDQETNSYIFQIFEVKDGHTNTYNWYEVNKESGELKRMFP